MRGFGYSSYQKPVHKIEDLSNDIDLFMHKTFWNVNSFFVFGHGIGCAVAIDLAVKHPHKVKGLFLLNPKSSEAQTSEVNDKNNFQ